MPRVVLIQKGWIRSVHPLKSRTGGIPAVISRVIYRFLEATYIAHAFITCVVGHSESISSSFGVIAHLNPPPYSIRAEKSMCPFRLDS